jgi:hypothetical protein
MICYEKTKLNKKYWTRKAEQLIQWLLLNINKHLCMFPFFSKTLNRSYKTMAQSGQRCKESDFFATKIIDRKSTKKERKHRYLL